MKWEEFILSLDSVSKVILETQNITDTSRQKLFMARFRGVTLESVKIPDSGTKIKIGKSGITYEVSASSKMDSILGECLEVKSKCGQICYERTFSRLDKRVDIETYLSHIHSESLNLIATQISPEDSMGLVIEETIVPFTSTNVLLAMPSKPIYLKIISALIIAFQLCIMIYLAVSNGFQYISMSEQDEMFFKVVISPFISAYVASTICQSLSDTTAEWFEGIFIDELKSLKETKWNPFMVLYSIVTYGLSLVVIILLSLIPILWIIFWEVLILRNQQQMNNIVFLFEMILLGVTVSATISIVQQQTTIIGVIVNFSGLMLILELDDLVAKQLNLPKTKVKILKYKDEEKRKEYEEHKEGAKTLSQQYLFLYVFVACVTAFTLS
eukprot:CAMPEP_0170059402 /NCGR_PEP_ID=MMETSP0019_2-20121128/1691_1 /TAXON_ID=98059 /ORGANISM="Dinobryon sp., Strain UTEXLB2267" /LENGTH=383 /DNA_ID=CAMNT_0010264639 /DNA_START=160 /DNA_END=1311 /DNA_ORIENTATION=-